MLLPTLFSSFDDTSAVSTIPTTQRFLASFPPYLAILATRSKRWIRRLISVPALEVAASTSSLDRTISKRHSPAAPRKRPASGRSSQSLIIYVLVFAVWL